MPPTAASEASISDRRTPDRADARSPMSTQRLVAAGVVIVLAGVLLVQNRDEVTIELLLVEISGPVWLVGLAMFALGALTAWLVSGLRARRGSKR